MTVTVERLKHLLRYIPDTGDFVWINKNRLANRVKLGTIAGGIDGYGYVQISIDNRRHLAHRLAWLYVYEYWPKKSIDHINGIKTDNRICNLRLASQSENCRNKSILVTNTSGYKGVSKAKDSSGWRAQIMHAGKVIYLGTFRSKIEAAAVYDKAAADLHGEFARTNNLLDCKRIEEAMRQPDLFVETPQVKPEQLSIDLEAAE